MKAVAIIRDRGQLTIPDSIRKVVNWVAPMSAVFISVEKSGEIVIKPHRRTLNGDAIWPLVKAARAIKGKSKVTESAAEFLKQDRRSH